MCIGEGSTEGGQPTFQASPAKVPPETRTQGWGEGKGEGKEGLGKGGREWRNGLGKGGMSEC